MNLFHRLSMLKCRTLLLHRRNKISQLRNPTQNLALRRPKFRKQLLMRTSKMARIIKALTLRRERKMAKYRKKRSSLATKAERKTRKRRVENEGPSFLHEIIL